MKAGSNFLIYFLFLHHIPIFFVLFSFFFFFLLLIEILFSFFKFSLYNKILLKTLCIKMITHIWIFRIISVLKYYFALLSFLFNVIKNALFSSLPCPKNNNSVIFSWIGSRDYTLFYFFWEESKNYFSYVHSTHDISLFSCAYLTACESACGRPCAMQQFALDKEQNRTSSASFHSH